MRTRPHRGFTLIETTAALLIVTLVAVGLVSVSRFLIEKQQRELTQNNLSQLRRAISGNPVIVANEARTSFGYLGDMGRLPTDLQELWVKGSQPAFTFNTSRKTGAGWNGPYLEVSPAEYASAIARDGWGNLFFYSDSAFVDSGIGAQVLGKLASLGPDFSLESADDVAIQFFEADVRSRIQGFVKDPDNNAVSGVGVTVNYPQNGTLTSQVVYSDSTGYYSAEGIPFGSRSLTVEPKLVLAPGTTVISGGANQHLRFTVKNYAAADISVTSLSLAYTIVPDAWFGRIEIDGAVVFNSTSPRFGNGDSVGFSSKTAKGTGLNAESTPIQVQSPVTDVADLILGKVGAGGSLVIELREFYDVESGGGGTDVDVSGVNFEVTFRDALNEVVGVVAVIP